MRYVIPVAAIPVAVAAVVVLSAIYTGEVALPIGVPIDTQRSIDLTYNSSLALCEQRLSTGSAESDLEYEECVTSVEEWYKGQGNSARIVTKIVDGDTIRTGSETVRFVMASAPEISEDGGPEAKKFIEETCPVGSAVMIDEDSGQPEGSYDRIIAVVYCNGVNLNEELLDSGHGYLLSDLCDKSEFAGDAWAQRHGC